MFRLRKRFRVLKAGTCAALPCQVRLSHKSIINFQEETSMGLFSKFFKGPEVDMEKSNANAKKCACSLIKWWKTGTTTV